MGDISVTNSASNETEVKLQESIRGKEVYIIQSGSKRVNNDVMEMMTMIYACKSSSARKIVGNSSVRSSGLGIRLWVLKVDERTMYDKCINKYCSDTTFQEWCHTSLTLSSVKWGGGHALLPNSSLRCSAMPVYIPDFRKLLLGWQFAGCEMLDWTLQWRNLIIYIFIHRYEPSYNNGSASAGDSWLLWLFSG